MKRWRAFLAVMLLVGSQFGLWWGTLYLKDIRVQTLIFLVAIDLGLLALGFAQDDGAERNK
jgi:hypothetical protein